MSALSPMSPHPSRPANLLTIFQAHFHVKRGNEITYQHGHEIDLTGVEWSVLPSGSHSLDTDVIWFVPPNDGTVQDSAGVASSSASAPAGASLSSTVHNRIGVAVFKNRRLTAEEEREQGEELDQRGARMIAVGFVALCPACTAPALLAACLPHLNALHRLADASSLDPSNRDILDAFLDERKFEPDAYEEAARALQESAAQRSPQPFSRRPLNIHDPVLDLPAIANALGLILPNLLKTLLRSYTRLLIFTPPGANTSTAASIAWNLAEIVQGALDGREDGEDDDDEADKDDDDDVPAESQPRTQGPRMRGILSLQDITQLDTEERARAESRFQTERHQQQHGSTTAHSAHRDGSLHSWIAYTTDKLFLEKPQLYDYLLDLSPLCAAAAAASAAYSSYPSLSPSSPTSSSPVLAHCETSTPSSSPIFSRVERTVTTTASRPLVKLKQQPWHPRDFAIYRANELRSVRLASRPRNLVRRSSRSSIAATAAATAQPSRPSSTVVTSPSPRISSPGALLSTLIAFLRYYLSSMWFIPHQWRINLRESYGYVPLSIRPDGGVQAGLMILPDSDSEDGEGSDSSDDGIEGDSTTASSASETECEGENNRNSIQRPRSPDNNDHLQVHSARRSRENTRASGGGGGGGDDHRRQRTSTSVSSSSRDRDRDVLASPNHSDFEIDPILAACGAGPSNSRRLSFGSRSSHSSAPNNHNEAIDDKRRSSLGFDNSTGGEDSSELTDSTVTISAVKQKRRSRAGDALGAATPARSPLAQRDSPRRSRDDDDDSALASATSSRRHHRRRRSYGNDDGLDDVDDAHRDARDGLLARAIYTIWSEWLCELVLGLQKLERGEDAAGEDAAALLPSTLAPLTSREFTALGLNISSQRDRELVADWTRGTRDIAQPGWWASLGLGGWL